MKGIWLKLRQILCSGLMVCVLLCSLGVAHAWAVESWQVYSVERTDLPSIDWDQIVHDAVPTGTYLKLDGTFYYVISSSPSGSPGSWSGPSFYIASLQVCDQQSGTPQTYYDVGTFTDQPLYATLSTSLAGQWVEYYPSWPTGGATNCPSLVQVGSAQVDEFSPGKNAAGERIWAEYDRVTDTTRVISTVHGTLATATGQYLGLSTSINFDNDVVFTVPGTTTIEGIINNFPIFPLSGKFPAINDAGVIVYVVDDINGSVLWSTAPQSPLASSTGQITAPDINNNGDVVWAENKQVWNEVTFVFDTVWTIYRLDYGQTVPTPVASASHYMNFPTISDAGEVVWSDQGDLVSSTRGVLASATSGCVPAMEGWDADFVGNDSLIFIGFEPDPAPGTQDIYQLALNAPPVGSHCSDTIWNSDETGIDCGGADCAPCGGAAHCSDAVMNYDETGMDCGGVDCAPCGGAAHCSDAVMNYDETGIDCGGADCAPCGGGGTCYDGIQNQDESGIDCGGTICAPCGGVAHCSDTIMNYDETGVDCGGADCDACGVTPYSIVSGAKVDFVGSINDMGEVVWSQFDTETNYQQIYSSIRGRLTDSAVDHWSPSVNNLGDVVWRQSPVCQSVCDAQNSCHEECAPATIHGLVGGDLGFVAMATEGSFPDINPHINSLGEVVWEQFNADTGVGQIFSSSRGKLLENTTRYFRPVLNDVGELIWSQQDGVVLHQSGDPLLTVEVAAGTVSGAFISNNGEIVWSEGPPGDWDNLKIYSKTRNQLTFGLPLGSHDAPSVNSCGDVLFSASTYDGMDSLTDLSRLGENAPCFVATEPNEGEVQALPIVVGDVKQGALSTQSNVEDWYRFDAPQTETVYIRLNFNAAPGNALTVELRNSVGGVLAQLDNASVSPLSPISLTVSATESYYIVARASAGDFGYALSIEIDVDGDGVRELFDNCPGTANADQIDTDSDGQGDACDNDDDGDAVLDYEDNCPLVANADQADGDLDIIGDVCDDDWDNDSLLNLADNCPLVSNAAQLDADADGFGDACDALCVNPQVAVGDGFLVALQADGKVVASSQDDFNPNLGGWVDANGWDNILGIAAGRYHTVAVTYNGTVLGAGSSGANQLDLGSWQDIIAVAAGDAHTVGLKADGTVVAVGHSLSGQLAVESWSDIVAISAGAYHTVGLKSDGTVVAVGRNVNGQLEVGTWTDIVAIASGYEHTVGLRSDGTVVAAGSNDYGELEVGTWTDIVKLAAGRVSTTIGLKADGTVVAVGWNDFGTLNVGSWNEIVAIAAGSVDTIGIKADGTLVTSRAAWPDSDSWLLGLSRPDLDRDGLPDNCDVCSGDPLGDADGDGLCFAADPCPSDPFNDTDGDTVCGDIDNCPTVTNTDQVDADKDGLGDACDLCPNDADNDTDTDGICGNVDNCPTEINIDQSDVDNDGLGDACDSCPNDAENDVDSDGICGDVDNCPALSNAEQFDSDFDGLGNTCDSCPNDAENDVDSDGICADVDNCPSVANAGQIDSDGDSIGDACDHPVTTVVPVAGSYNASQNVTLSSDGLTIYYTTDGSPPTTTSSVYSGPIEVSDGTTIVSYFAISAAGVVEEVKTVTYTIDSTAPVITISSPSAGFHQTTAPLLSYTVDNPETTTVVVKLDGSIIAASSGSSLAGLAQGEHTLRIEATDAVGNTAYLERIITVDTLAPELSITQMTAITNSSSQILNGTMEQGSLLTVGSNSAAILSAVTYPESSSWQVGVSNLPKDNTVLTFTLFDAAGNQTVINRTIRYNLPPTSTAATIVTADNTAAAPVTPTVSDPNQIDEFTFTLGTQPAHGTVVLVGNQLVYTPTANYYGADSFSYIASDSGSLSVNGTAHVVINATPPQKVTGATLAVLPNLAIRLNWTPSVSSDAQTYRIYWDNGTGTVSYAAPYATVTHPGSSFETAPLPEGTYRFVIRTEDSAHQIETNTSQLIGRADASPPASPVNLVGTVLTGAKIKVSWSASPSNDVQKYTLYGDSGSGTVDYDAPLAVNGGTQLSSTVTGLTAGAAYRFGVIAEDGNGNRSPAVEVGPVAIVYPDLLVTGVSWTPQTDIRFGASVEFTVQVANTGSIATGPQGFYVGIALDGEPLPAEYFPGVLAADAPGNTVDITFSRTMLQVAKNYTLTATVDRFKQQEEADEANNISAPVSFFITPGYLVAVRLDQEAYVPGSTVAVTAQVANSTSPGSYFTDADVQLTAALHDAGGSPMIAPQGLAYALVAGQPAFTVGLALPPELPAGDYTLVVLAQGLGAQAGVSKTVTQDVVVAEGVTLDLQTDMAVYYPNQPVAISGQVQTITGAALEGEPVLLSVQSNGRSFTVSTMSDAAGTFTYNFSPFPGTGGEYQVSARTDAHRLVTTAACSFEVEGLFVTPTGVNLSNVPKNSPVSIIDKIKLINIGSVPVSGITITVDDLDAGDGVTATLQNQPLPESLDPGGFVYVNLDLTSTLDSPQLAGFNVEVAADGLPVASLPSVPLRIKLVDPVPLPEVSPVAFTAGVSPGGVATRQVTFRNGGFGLLHNVVAQAEGESWVSVVGGVMGDLQPGEVRTFDVVLQPGTDTLVGTYLVPITISSTELSMQMVNATVEVSNAAQGNIDFLVTNDNGSFVSGATVRLVSDTDHISGDIVHKDVIASTVGIDGVATFTDIPVDGYSYQIDAPNHATVSGHVDLGPGANSAVVVNLEANNISLEWSVTPTTVQDNYLVEATIVMSVDQVKPILVLRPNLLEVSMSSGETISDSLSVMAPGETPVYDLVLDSSALRARGLELVFVNPDGSESDLAMIDYLPVRTTVVLPYRVRLLPGADTMTRDIGNLVATGSYTYNDVDNHQKIGTTRGYQLVRYRAVPVPEIVPAGQSLLDLEVTPSVIMSTEYCESFIDNNLDLLYDANERMKIDTHEIRVYNTGSETITLQNAYGITAEASVLDQVANLLGVGAVQKALDYLASGSVPYLGSVWRGVFVDNTLAPGESTTMQLQSVSSTVVGINLPDIAVEFGSAFFDYSDGITNKTQSIPIFNTQICGLDVKVPTIYVSHTQATNPDEPPGPQAVDINLLQGEVEPPPAFDDLNLPEVPPSPVGTPTITLKLQQDVALERTYFKADLKVTALAAAMENVQTELLVTDLTGDVANPADSQMMLFNHFKDADGFTTVDGVNSLAQGHMAKLLWNIFPLASAGGVSPQGRQYQVAARLNYMVNGINHSVVTPAEIITVLPEPLLTIEYSVPTAIYSGYPFQVDVVVTNNGYGAAKNFKIGWPSPLIAQNNTGLPANFSVLRTIRDGVATEGGKELSFGDVAPGQAVSGTWVFMPSVTAEVIDFNARLTQELIPGVPLTSIVADLYTYRIPVQYGVCGSADGQVLAAPPTFNLCMVGTAGELTGSGPWSWTCQGLDSAQTDTCTALLDSDGDGIDDSVDNCITTINADQADFDGDKRGDACDSDLDGDGISNALEERYNLNPADPFDGGEDLDGDGISNADEIAAGTDPTRPGVLPQGYVLPQHIMPLQLAPEDGAVDGQRPIPR